MFLDKYLCAMLEFLSTNIISFHDCQSKRDSVHFIMVVSSFNLWQLNILFMI